RGGVEPDLSFRTVYIGRATAGFGGIVRRGRGTLSRDCTMSEETKGAAGVKAVMDGRIDERVGLVTGGEPMRNEGMDWFVLRVASNKESSVRETLLRKV